MVKLKIYLSTYLTAYLIKCVKNNNTLPCIAEMGGSNATLQCPCHDKTDLLRRSGRLEHTANYWTVALDIWRTIHFPVTQGMLTE